MSAFDCLSPDSTLDGYHLLEASAGTGKTFAIQHLTARLLLQKISLKDILVVTFTRAATRDLKSRIHTSLETLFEEKPPYLAALSSDEQLEAKLEIEAALTLFDEAQVFTIHGFCQKMLTEFGFELGIGSSLFSQKKESYQDLITQEVTDFLHTSLPPHAYSAKQLTSLMKYCNFDKEKLMKKLIQLIEQEGELPTCLDYQGSQKQFHALNIPYLSFEQILRLAPAFLKICDKQGLLKQPFQNQYEALLRKDFENLLIKPSLFSFLRPENRSKKIFKEEELVPLYKLGERLTPSIEQAIDPKQILMRMASSAKNKIKQTLMENELFSPDDLLIKMKEALLNPTFRSKVHARYKAVIIDEFQDTDTHQWSIFKTLFIDQPIQAFYIVGDPKQSIYGFRGADLPTYFEAKNSMHQVSYLKTNYRSEPTLLHSLNLLFSKQKHFPYRAIQPNPQTTDTSFTDRKKPLHFFTATVEKKREKSWPSPKIESDYFFPFIAREIEQLTKKNHATFKDFAILVKDRYQGARLKTYLENLNIPILAKSTKPLTETLAYTFFKAFLNALINPKQISTFLTHPIFQFTHHEMKNGSHVEASAFFHKSSQPFYKIIDAALHHQWKPNQTLLELLVQNHSLDTYADFMQLTELLLECPNHSFTQLLEYLTHLPSDQPKYCRRPLCELNAVTIMTIHLSKGLEFPIVFALGLINRNTFSQDFLRDQKRWIPFSTETSICQAALQKQEVEKIRQLYVALTRAKKRLYVPALFDSSNAPLSFGKASPIELLLSDLPPLEKLLCAINATHTELRPDIADPIPFETPSIYPPLIKKNNFPIHHIKSFSSLSHHIPHGASPKTIETDLPKGAETGLLLHALLEKIIREKLTHPYKHQKIHSLIGNMISHTPFSSHFETITDLIDLTFHHSFGTFSLADIPLCHLHPEVEFLYFESAQTSFKGFIDLIFFYGNGYYIVDWKTNLLPNYKKDTLQQEMEQMNYFLQAKIYTEALRRYLTFKDDSHPIIGSYYLFLRGLPENEGLYFIPNEI